VERKRQISAGLVCIESDSDLDATRPTQCSDAVDQRLVGLDLWLVLAVAVAEALGTDATQTGCWQAGEEVRSTACTGERATGFTPVVLNIQKTGCISESCSAEVPKDRVGQDNVGVGWHCRQCKQSRSR